MKRPTKLVIALVLLFGVIVRAIEYGAMGSMWYDELAIALNVTRRDWAALLFHPLDYAQVAPQGFLALEKLAVGVLGENEAAFRLFPFLFSLLSLVLFWRVSTRYLSTGAQTLALVLFAASRSLMMYAKEAKPYAGDVAAVLLLTLLAIRFQEGRREPRQLVLAALLGGLAISASFPAVMIACGLGLVLLIDRWKERQPLRPLGWVILPWVACSLLVALISRMTLSPGTHGFMLRYWQAEFMPAPWQDLSALLWLPGRIAVLLAYAIAGLYPDSFIEFVFVGIFAALLLIGVPHLVRRGPTLAALLLVPLIGSILASALHILPLAPRVSLYVAPLLLIGSVAGIDFLRTRASGILGFAIASAGLALILTTAIGFLVLRPPPHRREESRPVLHEMHDRWEPNDEIYVLDGGRLAMEYYGSRIGLTHWIQGERHDGNFLAHLRHVDALRGNARAWLFYTHPRFCERELTRGYLQTIGREIDRIEDPYGKRGSGEAAALLYDLSDPERLERASPEAFFTRATELCGSPEPGDDE